MTGSGAEAGPAAAPTARLLLAHPAHFVALGFGSGLAPVGPGTAGTLVAFPLHWAATATLGLAAHAALIALLFVAGIWASARTARVLGTADHGAVVIDEIVAFMLVLLLVPAALAWQIAACVLFRAFDIAKPWPIRWCDRHVKGGFGVMLDDLVAGAATVAVVVPVAAIGA